MKLFIWISLLSIFFVIPPAYLIVISRRAHAGRTKKTVFAFLTLIGSWLSYLVFILATDAAEK